MPTRVRGFARYRPQARGQVILDAVKDVLKEYENILPITLRQLFYRLVVREVLEKTEKQYKQLTEYMNRARRGEIIAWEAIRDDGFEERTPIWYANIEEVRETIESIARDFRLDRQQGQKRRLQLWCEAAGMVPQLERIAEPYGIVVASSGGFDSVTSKHTIGRSLASGGPLTVLHIGDYDPSGEHMFTSLAEDVIAFAEAYGGNVEFIRLAVTAEQIAEYDLPTAPPKETDQRSFSGEETTQAEALDPRQLADIVEYAIRSRMNMAAYKRVLAAEKAARAALTAKPRRR